MAKPEPYAPLNLKEDVENKEKRVEKITEEIDEL